MKKLVGIVLGCVMSLMLVSSMAACGQKGDKLVIWTFTDELQTMVNDYYSKDNPDVAVDVKVYEVNSLDTLVTNSMLSGKNLPDVLAIEEKFLRKYIEDDIFEPLEGLSDKSANMYDYTINAAKNSEGEQVAYAWQATPGAFFYRTDMAKELLGIESPEQMEEKLGSWQENSWEKFVDLAAELRRESAAGQNAQFEDVRILSAVNEISIPFYSARESGWAVENSAGEKVLTIDPSLYQGDYSMLDVYKRLQIGDGTYGSGQKPYVNEQVYRQQGWFSDMSGNKVFGYLLSSYSLHYDLKANAKSVATGNDTSGKWGVCKAPVAYSDGGTWLAVLNTSDKKEEAQKLIEYFTMNEDFLTKWANDTGDFINNKKIMNAFAADPERSEPFLGGQNHYALFAEIAEELNGNNLTVYDAILNDNFTTWAINYGRFDQVGNEEGSALVNALDSFVTSAQTSFRDSLVTNDPPYTLS